MVELEGEERRAGRLLAREPEVQERVRAGLVDRRVSIADVGLARIDPAALGRQVPIPGLELLAAALERRVLVVRVRGCDGRDRASSKRCQSMTRGGVVLIAVGALEVAARERIRSWASAGPTPGAASMSAATSATGTACCPARRHMGADGNRSRAAAQRRKGATRKRARVGPLRSFVSVPQSVPETREGSGAPAAGPENLFLGVCRNSDQIAVVKDLGDLDRVGGGALEQVVRDDPHAQAALV